MPFRLVVWDFDGTLVDSLAASLEIFNRHAEELRPIGRSTIPTRSGRCPLASSCAITVSRSGDCPGWFGSSMRRPRKESNN